MLRNSRVDGLKGFIFFSLYLFILLAFTTSAVAQEMKAIEEGAKKEGKLNLYGSMREDEAADAFKAFNQKYPFVKVDYFRGSETKLLARILTEAKAGAHNFDLLITTAAVQLKDLKMGLNWVPPSAGGFRPELKDKDGIAHPIYINTNVIQYNTKLVPKADAPKGYQDLANPKWKGKLCLEDSDEEWFMGVMEFMGKEKALSLFKRIAANQPAVRNGHGLLSDLVAAGECYIAINNYGNQVARAQKKGAPTDFVAIEPVVTIIAPGVISNKAPHPNAAKLYLNWITTKEGQEAIGRWGRIPVRVDVDPDPPRLTKGLKLHVIYTLHGGKRKEVANLYKQIWEGR
jgi:iron(III) transport system substrate-binding protein